MRNKLNEILMHSLYQLIVIVVFYILFSVGNGTFDFTEWAEKSRWLFCVCGSLMYLAMLLGG